MMNDASTKQLRVLSNKTKKKLSHRPEWRELVIIPTKKRIKASKKKKITIHNVAFLFALV